MACATFGSSTWGSIVNTAVSRKKFYACQRVKLLRCRSACRTVSTDALQVFLRAPPFELEAQRLALLFQVKRRPSQIVGESFYDWNVKELKRRLDEYITSEWLNRWSTSVKGRVTFDCIRDVNHLAQKTRFRFNLSLRLLLSLHGSLNAFLHKTALSDLVSCMCGAERENWLHVL